MFTVEERLSHREAGVRVPSLSVGIGAGRRMSPVLTRAGHHREVLPSHQCWVTADLWLTCSPDCKATVVLPLLSPQSLRNRLPRIQREVLGSPEQPSRKPSFADKECTCSYPSSSLSPFLRTSFSSALQSCWTEHSLWNWGTSMRGWRCTVLFRGLVQDT